MIQLASLFSDGAVLQRNMQIPVWGKTAPKTIVHVVCGNAESCGKSSADGRFTVYLPALPAGGPLEMTVSANDETVTVRDILVGEVWIAGGQSNMEIRLDWKAPAECVKKGEVPLNEIHQKEFMDSIQDPEQIRSILVLRSASATEEDSFYGSWRKMTEEDAPKFSAVAAWFAKSIQEKLHVPVGLIESNCGGSIAEAWTSRSGLMRNPATAAMLREMDTKFYKKSPWEYPYLVSSLRPQLEKSGAKHLTNQGFSKGYASPEFNDSSWKEMNIPGSWIKQKIAGNGVIWARRSVEIPADWAGKPLFLRLAGVDKHDITYFNGIEVGRTGEQFEASYWDSPRKYPVPADAVKSGCAVIAIRAYSFMWDGIISSVRLENPETGEQISLDGTWKACAEADFGRLSPTNDPNLKYSYGNPNLPAALFNGMIRPLIPYAIRGVIWYQGESNAVTRQDAESYYAKLRCLIDDWRYQWAQGDFPFIQMLLAGYGQPQTFSTEENWPYLRDAQLRLCKDMNAVYVASAVDIGNPLNAHPLNKKDAGQRMARIALSELYHIEGIVPAGPRLLRSAVYDNHIRLEFENEQGLAFRDSEPKGFILTDAENKIIPVEAVVIENDTVVLQYKAGTFPKELYYGWADNPEANLVNGAGLPADPFHVIL